MDSAELMVLKPRKASPLTGGEYTGVLPPDSALTVCIDGNKQNARNIVPAQNLDMMELKRNIHILLLFKIDTVNISFEEGQIGPA
jgi:hypothetical protein